jgi:hypothetical protein
MVDPQAHGGNSAAVDRDHSGRAADRPAGSAAAGSAVSVPPAATLLPYAGAPAAAQSTTAVPLPSADTDASQAALDQTPAPAPAPRSDRASVVLMDGAGGVARIRVAVTGDRVTATIVHTDQVAAAQLGGKAAELERSLAAHGFQAPHVVVRPAALFDGARAGDAAPHVTPSPSVPVGDMTQAPERRDALAGDGRRPPSSDGRRQSQQDRSQQRSQRERER